MRQKLFLFTLLLIVAQFYSQQRILSQKNHIAKTTELQNKVSALESENQNLKSKLDKLSTEQSKLNSDIKVLEVKSDSTNSELSKFSSELNSKIQTADNSAKEGFAKIDKNLSSSRIFWIIGLLATALLGYLLYTLLGKKINTSSSTWEKKLKSDRSALETQIQNTKKSLEEESVKLDSKLVELLESQYKISDEKQVINPTIHNDEIDHSLALKVADEIVRMQKNISKMDSETKGLKPLIKGIERIQNNFVSNGYEMINLINQNYDERMNIDVINFLSDENLPEGSKIISSVIKPQVNYNGVLIQRAQVDVSQN